jgi:hypothetical protein
MIDWILQGGWIALCGFFGPRIWMQNPVPRIAKPVAKTAKRSTKRTNRKNRTVQKSAKKAKPKKVKWAKPPKYTAEQLANIERMFRKGRGENKFDNWAGVPL